MSILLCSPWEHQAQVVDSLIFRIPDREALDEPALQPGRASNWLHYVVSSGRRQGGYGGEAPVLLIPQEFITSGSTSQKRA